jgi:hypothetical protein
MIPTRLSNHIWWGALRKVRYLAEPAAKHSPFLAAGKEEMALGEVNIKAHPDTLASSSACALVCSKPGAGKAAHPCIMQGLD